MTLARLQEQFASIQKDMGRLEKDVNGLRGEIKEFKTAFYELKEHIIEARGIGKGKRALIALLAAAAGIGAALSEVVQKIVEAPK